MALFLYDLFVGWARYGFMRVALYGVLLFAPMFGLLGSMVVDSRMAFFSDSLGHGALTGIAVGLLLGVGTPLLPMLVFGVAFALLLAFVRARGRASTDTTISVFSATAMALGVVLLTLRGDFAKYSNYLVGDLLAMSAADLPPLAAALALVILYTFLRYNRFLLSFAQPALAISRGVPVRATEIGFSCLVAVVVMLSIRWVGVLMINAMLVLPAAAARNRARNTCGYVWGSVTLALGCGVLGLLLSFALGTASGATIVLLLAVGYALSFIKR